MVNKMRKVGPYYKNGYGPAKKAIGDYHPMVGSVGWEKDVLKYDLLDSIQHGKEGVDFVFADKNIGEGGFNKKTQAFTALAAKKLGPDRDVKAWRIRDLEKVLLSESFVEGEARKSYYRSSLPKNRGELECIELADAKVGWRYVKVTISAKHSYWIIVLHGQEKNISDEDGWWSY